MRMFCFCDSPDYSHVCRHKQVAHRTGPPPAGRAGAAYNSSPRSKGSRVLLRILWPLLLDGRYQLVLRCKDLNNLPSTMTRVRFLLDLYKPERCQDLDISLRGGPVPFENY